MKELKMKSLNTEKIFIDREKLYGLIDQKVTDSQVDEVLNRAMQLKGLDLKDAAVLLNIKDEKQRNKVFEAAGKAKEIIYGKRIVLFAPLYLGNVCTNNCVYCSFRKDNTALKRAILTDEQIQDETKLLLKMGHKRLLVIGGEARATDVEYYAHSIRKVYETNWNGNTVRRINVEIAPQSEDNFRLLKKEKIGTYICFQETYDEKLYPTFHPSGLKADYGWRLLVMDRALRAGLNDVGIGALFGLTDYRFETLALLEHANHLDKTFGIGPHTVSVPRIEPAEGAPLSYNIPHPVSDDEFMLLVAVIRLSLPYTGIILSTRENDKIRTRLLHYGVSQVSAASRTNPGGYEEDEAGAQFSLGDHRSVDEVVSSLIDGGYIPSFCTGCYRRGRVGADFMDLAKPGLIHEFCLPNGMLTFKEYLEDFASPETKAKGEKLLVKLMDDIENPERRAKTQELLGEIEKGKRDLYF